MLEKGCWGLVSMKTTREIPNMHEIIMDASPFDEGTLSVGDDGVHMGGEPGCKHLDYLGYCMDEANGSKLGMSSTPSFFGKRKIFSGLRKYNLST